MVLNADYQPLSYLPLSSWSWQDAVKAVWQERVDVVETYDVAVRSASATFEIPSVVVLKKYEPRGLANPRYSKRLLLLRDRYRCQYCMKRFPQSALTCDHVVPRRFGGTSTWENCVACCRPCNDKKASSLPSELKHKGMRAPSPKTPSAYELEAAARAFALNNLRREDIHDSWKIHLEDEFEMVDRDAPVEETIPQRRLVRASR